MINRRSDDRKPQGNIHAVMKVQKFKRDQPLIVIHGYHRIIMSAGCLVKYGIRRQGAFDINPFIFGSLDRRQNNIFFFTPEHPAFTGMGIECCHGNTGCFQAKSVMQCLPC